MSSIGNPYYFTGRRYDGEAAIYYYRARYYDPTIGRFLQRDPLGYYDSMNLYSYVTNSPTNFVDPYGLHEEICLFSYHNDDKLESDLDKFFEEEMDSLIDGIYEEKPTAVIREPDTFNTFALGVALMALSQVRPFYKGGNSWHVGVELEGQRNLFHMGRHSRYGFHIAIGYIGRKFAWLHLYFKLRRPFLRVWFPD